MQLGMNLMNPNNFETPQKFQPQRWNGEGVKNMTSFMPFSSGPRNCIGQHMSKI